MYCTVQTLELPLFTARQHGTAPGTVCMYVLYIHTIESKSPDVGTPTEMPEILTPPSTLYEAIQTRFGEYEIGIAPTLW